jgi:hypothetical protein
VAVREAAIGRDALVGQTGTLELERLGRRAELEVRRAVEVRPEVVQIRPEVPVRERHGAILRMRPSEAMLIYSMGVSVDRRARVESD